MQYLLLIHSDTTSAPAPREWEEFIERAKVSGTFRGGSAIGKKQFVGNTVAANSSDHIAGFMRFDGDDKQRILELLNEHPVVRHGGTVELCEMPTGTGS